MQDSNQSLLNKRNKRRQLLKLRAFRLGKLRDIGSRRGILVCKLIAYNAKPRGSKTKRKFELMGPNPNRCNY